jgi:hypothetical protein
MLMGILVSVGSTYRFGGGEMETGADLDSVAKGCQLDLYKGLACYA